jgi:PAS domain S-box-containing protein
MVGYEREYLVSGRMRWTDLTPPEWRTSDAKRVEEVKLTGTSQPFEKEYFHKDGRRVPVLVGVARIEEAGNQAVAFVIDLSE